jgi:hypothetical protein
MEELIFSETRLNNNTFCPMVDCTYKFSIALDLETFRNCQFYNLPIEDIIVAGFKQMLEEKLPERLKTINYGMKKYMKGKDETI